MLGEAAVLTKKQASLWNREVASLAHFCQLTQPKAQPEAESLRDCVLVAGLAGGRVIVAVLSFLVRAASSASDQPAKPANRPRRG